MTPREQAVRTLQFKSVDRVPFWPGGPRESTLRAWRTQGLSSEGPWQEHLWRELGFCPDSRQERTEPGVDFRMIPRFPEEVLDHKDGHYIVQDWKGNICEISDTFDVTYLRLAKDFVTRRWIKCPVENRDDWERMKARYRLDSPGRFADDFLQRAGRLAHRDYWSEVSFSGSFWQMREWCGFEGLCMLMIEQPDLVDEMAAFWTDFIEQVLGRMYAQLVPDSIHISEDMAYKAHAMISPAMTRRFCKPSWDRWTAQARRAGVPLVRVDSDGFVGELIPLWIESGVNACDPMEVAAHNDLVEYRRIYGEQMAYVGGVDKRAIAKGGSAIRQELMRLDPVVREGGYVPGCDHGVPFDISWPNFLDYCRLLAKMTGWA